MRNEKPGGHGERSTAVGTIDMAIWDIVSKIEQVPLYELLAKNMEMENLQTKFLYMLLVVIIIQVKTFPC